MLYFHINLSNCLLFHSNYFFPVFLSLKKLHYDYSVTNKRLNLNNPEINLPIYYCKSPFFLHIPGENLYPKNLDLTNISFFCNSSCFSGSPPVFSSMHELIILRSRSITLVPSVSIQIILSAEVLNNNAWDQKAKGTEKCSRLVMRVSILHFKKWYPLNWFPSAKELNILLEKVM